MAIPPSQKRQQLSGFAQWLVEQEHRMKTEFLKRRRSAGTLKEADEGGQIKMGNTQLVKFDTSHGEVALTLGDVKKQFCPLATDREIWQFVQLCRYQGLNPWLREVHLIKYSESSPASIIVGKDTFTQRAEKHSQCAGFEAGVVVLSQSAELIRRQGTIVLDGETLIGGWAKVYRKDWKVPLQHEVGLQEYDKGQAMWKTLKATMIRKVALVQALREAFPSTLVGLYDEAEPGDALPLQPPATTESQETPPPGETGTPALESGSRKPDKAHWCEEHGVAFKKHEKEGKVWYSHIKPDGSWCNEGKLLRDFEDGAGAGVKAPGEGKDTTPAEKTAVRASQGQVESTAERMAVRAFPEQVLGRMLELAKETMGLETQEALEKRIHRKLADMSEEEAASTIKWLERKISAPAPDIVSPPP